MREWLRAATMSGSPEDRDGAKTLPPHGKFNELGSDVSPAKRKLAAAAREMIAQTGMSLEAISKRSAKLVLSGSIRRDELLSSSYLSRLLNGQYKRPPRKAPLRALRDLAAEFGGTDEVVISWDALEELRMASGSRGNVDLEAGSRSICPACGRGSGRRRGRPAGRERVGGRTVVPVPHPEGDRHNGTEIDVAWPPVATLARYVSAGDLERASGIIRHVSTEAKPEETAHAIISCRDFGLDDAADALFSYAAHRAHRDVMEIMQSLVDRGRHDEVRTLLGRALADSV